MCMWQATASLAVLKAIINAAIVMDWSTRQLLRVYACVVVHVLA